MIQEKNKNEIGGWGGGERVSPSVTAPKKKKKKINSNQILWVCGKYLCFKEKEYTRELGGIGDYYLILFLLCVKRFKVASLHISKQHLLLQRSLWIKLWWKMFRKGKKRHSSSSSQSSEISTKSKVGGGVETAAVTVRTVSSEQWCVKGTKHGRPVIFFKLGILHFFFCTRYILFDLILFCFGRFF